MVKSLPAVHETQAQSLGWEDPLEKEMETHSNILVWKIHWMEEPGRLQSMRSQRVRHIEYNQPDCGTDHLVMSVGLLEKGVCSDQ